MYIQSYTSNMHKYFPRYLEKKVQDALSKYPVVVLLGPRQCGKSTLAKKVLSRMGRVAYLDLERPSDRAKLQDAEAYFSSHRGDLVCLDEIQRVPELFPILRAIVDSGRGSGQFLVLGSASRDLLRQSSESLAGRIAYLELTPFLNFEVPPSEASQQRLWLRGGFPKSFQARSDLDSMEWRQNFVKTFLEMDVPALAPGFSTQSIERLWKMCAHWHGQLVNYSKLAGSLGVTDQTIRSWLSLLSGSFMVRLLPPFSSNLGKRLIKAPKVYLRDSGLLHTLLGLETMEDIFGHPAYGASWEGHALETILSRLRPSVHASFYRDSNGCEIDLVLERGTKRLALELKAGKTPEITKPFLNAIAALNIPKTFVISRALETYPLAKNVLSVSLSSLFEAESAQDFFISN